MATRNVELEVSITGDGIAELERMTAALAAAARASEQMDQAAIAAAEALARETKAQEDSTEKTEDNTKAKKQHDDQAQKTLSTRAALEEALRRALTVDEAVIAATHSLTKAVTENGEAYLESGEKVFDAQRKLSEYGATAKQQVRGLEKIREAMTKFNVSGTDAAIVMEELAIELQDSGRALRVYDRAIQHVAKSHKRTEDAVGDFADALKGDTKILRDYGAAGRRVADALDDIADPAERSRQIFANLGAVQRRAAGPVGQLNDKFASFKAGLTLMGPELAVVSAGVAVLVGGAIALGAAFVSLANKGLDFVADSFRVFAKETKQVAVAIELAEESVQNFKITLAEAALGGEMAGDRIALSFQILADKVDFLSGRMKAWGQDNRIVLDNLLGMMFSFSRATIKVFKRLGEGIILQVEVPLQALKALVESVGASVLAVHNGALRVMRLVGKASDEEAAKSAEKLQKVRKRAAQSHGKLMALVRGEAVGMTGAFRFAADQALDTMGKLENAVRSTKDLSKALRDSEAEKERTRKKAAAEAKKSRDAEHKAAKDQALVAMDEIAAEVESRKALEIKIKFAVDEMSARADVLREEQAMRSALEQRRGLARAPRRAIQQAEAQRDERAGGIGGQLFGAVSAEQQQMEADAANLENVLQGVGLTAETVGVQIQTAFAGAANAMGQALVSGENLGVALGAALASSVGGLLTTLGAQMVAAGLGFGLAPGLQPLGGAWVAGGLAVSAAGGVLQAFAGQIGGGGSSASAGGGASGGGGSTRAVAAGGGGILGDISGIRRGSEGPQDQVFEIKIGDDAVGRFTGRAVRNQQRQRALR